MSTQESYLPSQIAGIAVARSQTYPPNTQAPTLAKHSLTKRIINRTIIAALSITTRVFCGTQVDDPHDVLLALSNSSATMSETACWSLPHAPRVYVANHNSHADFLVLWTALPKRLQASVRPVAATDYWLAGPIRRYLSRQVFRAVLIDRRDMDARRNPLWPMLQALHHGDSLILFPEGSRGDGNNVVPFRCGLYHLARAVPDLEIVPLWMENTAKVLPRHAHVPLPIPCHIRVGTPLSMQSDEDKQHFLDRAREAVLALRSPCR